MERLFYIDGKVIAARTPQDAFRKAGKPMPEHLYPYNGFAVKYWLWNEADFDYTIEDLSDSGVKTFSEWPAALDCFRKLSEKDLPRLHHNELKVDLAQYGLGRCRIQLSKILLAPALR
jgi:hypothetical protein